jgi:flagellar FliL protein
MAEQETASPRKGSKIPLLMVVLLATALGVFLGMKLLRGEEVAKPLELGEIESLNEFIVNLNDGRSYLKTNISIQFKKGFDKKEFAKCLPAVRDAVILVLSAQSLADIIPLEGKDKLKHQLAEAINKVLNGLLSEGAPATPRLSPPPDLRGKGKDWDSLTGPVLKIYFTDFATQ